MIDNKKYIIGFDPGLTNLGMGVLNYQENTARLYNIKLTKRNLNVWLVTPEEIGINIANFVKDPEIQLIINETKFVIIERQLPFFREEDGAITDQKDKQIEYLVHVCEYVLAQTFRIMCPTIPVHLGSPPTMRQFWKTSSRIDYSDRKKKSLQVPLLIEEDMKKMKKTFFNGVEVRADPIEALMYAVYGYHKFQSTEDNKKPLIPTSIILDVTLSTISGIKPIRNKPILKKLRIISTNNNKEELSGVVCLVDE